MESVTATVYGTLARGLILLTSSPVRSYVHARAQVDRMQPTDHFRQ